MHNPHYRQHVQNLDVIVQVLQYPLAVLRKKISSHLSGHELPALAETVKDKNALSNVLADLDEKKDRGLVSRTVHANIKRLL